MDANRSGLRAALVDHNARLLANLPNDPRVSWDDCLDELMDVEDVLRRFDRGEAILRHGS